MPIKFWTIHFVRRFLIRFSESDLIKLERTIDLAIKHNPIDYTKQVQSKIKYTHPEYGFTVVIQRVGLNGARLITCWKKGESDEVRDD
jgi:hypothetical protein